MSRQLKIILLAGMALIMGFYSDCPAYAALSVNVNCVEDTYADWSSTNSNYGGASIVRINTFTRWRSFFKPNLSSLNNKLIVGADITVYSTDIGVGWAYATFRNVNGLWSENTLTWNNQPEYGPHSSSGFTNSTESSTLNIDFAARGWNIDNYGVVAVCEDFAHFYAFDLHSRESSFINKRPYFTIYYHNPPGTLSNSGAGQNNINVSWGANGNPGDAVYALFRNGSLVYKGTATSYNDTGLSAGTGYNYVVPASR